MIPLIAIGLGLGYWLLSDDDTNDGKGMNGSNSLLKLKNDLKKQVDKIPLIAYKITKHTDEDSEIYDDFDMWDKDSAMEAIKDLGTIDDDWNTAVLSAYEYSINDVDDFIDYFIDEYGLDADTEADLYDDELKDELQNEDGKFLTLNDVDDIEVVTFSKTNEITEDWIDKIKSDLRNVFGTTFNKYTRLDHPKDDDIDIQVRIADHSQRFNNIKSDYSISIVVANKDETGSERNFFRKGFSRRKIEAGEDNHAQIYINSNDFTYEEALEYVIEQINTQLDYAYQDSLDR